MKNHRAQGEMQMVRYHPGEPSKGPASLAPALLSVKSFPELKAGGKHCACLEVTGHAQILLPFFSLLLFPF